MQKEEEQGASNRTEGMAAAETSAGEAEKSAAGTVEVDASPPAANDEDGALVTARVEETGFQPDGHTPSPDAPQQPVVEVETLPSVTLPGAHAIPGPNLPSLPPGAYEVVGPGVPREAAEGNNPTGDDDIVLEGFLPPEPRETRDERLRREVQEMRDNAVLLDDSAVRPIPLREDSPASEGTGRDGGPPGGDVGKDGDPEAALPAAKSPLAFFAATALFLAAVALGVAFGGSGNASGNEESSSSAIGQDGGHPLAIKEPCFNDVRDRYDTAKEIVSSITSRENLDLAASPQSKALEWIVCEDKISSALMDARDPTTGALPKQAHGFRYGGDTGEAQVLRRYALAAFRFATSERGPWNETLNFLSPNAHECSWHKNYTVKSNFGFGSAGFDSAGFICAAWEYDPSLPHPPLLLDDAAMEISWVDFKIRVDNNLTGTIPSEFGHLIDVKNIGLEHQKGLHGTLPSTIGNMMNLESLSILFSGPNFGGVFPKSLFSIPALNYISLYYNEGVWSFPPAIDPNGGDRLLGVHMAYTGLSGTLPPYISGFKDLEELHLVGDSLEGSIPEFIGPLSSLKYLSLYDNNLNGTLPSSLAQFTNLTALVLGRNGFGGPIPSWIGNLSGLRLLDLGHNELEGELPTSFSRMSSLELVSLQNNLNLNGSIAPLGSLENLASLLVYSNNFSSSIPTEIFSSYNHTGKRIFADFGHNSFTGTLPAAFARWASNISYLSTMRNDFDADAIPDKVCEKVDNLFSDCDSCRCCRNCCSKDSAGGAMCEFDLDFFNVAGLECGVWWRGCWDAMHD